MIDTTFNLIVLSGKIFMSQIINHYPIETVKRDYNWKEANSHVANLLNCFFNIEQLICLLEIVNVFGIDQNCTVNIT